MKSVKSILNWGFKLMLIGLGLMILETIVFQFIYGWHWKAIGPWEKGADFICNTFLNVGFLLLLLVVIRVTLFVIDMYDETTEWLDELLKKKEEKND